MYVAYKCGVRKATNKGKSPINKADDAYWTTPNQKPELLDLYQHLRKWTTSEYLKKDSIYDYLAENPDPPSKAQPAPNHRCCSLVHNF